MKENCVSAQRNSKTFKFYDDIQQLALGIPCSRIDKTSDVRT